MPLEILKSDCLNSARHGFFTRKGGVSSGIFEGLNCGRGSSDASEAVAENKKRVAAALDVQSDDLCTVHQYHSNVVEIVSKRCPEVLPKADAMVTSERDVALGILTADCAPVLFADNAAGVIGSAHAGWKGALGGILEATVEAMEDQGAKRKNIQAAVGPCISQRAYEVGPEFMDRFVVDDPDYARFFAGGQNDRVQFDLPGFVLHRLQSAGVEQAEWIGHCTFFDPARFYSYRRTTHAGEPDYGRLISAIRL